MFGKLVGKARSLGAKVATVAAASVALVASTSANAALDVSIGTAVAGTSSDIAEVGTLLIGLAVVAMGIRWVKAAFF